MLLFTTEEGQLKTRSETFPFYAKGYCWRSGQRLQERGGRRSGACQKEGWSLQGDEERLYLKGRDSWASSSSVKFPKGFGGWEITVMINRRGNTNSMEFKSSDDNIRPCKRCETPIFETEANLCQFLLPVYGQRSRRQPHVSLKIALVSPWTASSTILKRKWYQIAAVLYGYSDVDSVPHVTLI